MVLSDFSSSPAIAGNAGEAFLVRPLYSSFYHFSIIFCIIFCGLGLDWAIREMGCHWGICERGGKKCFFYSFKVRKNDIPFLQVFLSSKKEVLHLQGSAQTVPAHLILIDSTVSRNILIIYRYTVFCHSAFPQLVLAVWLG